MAWPVQHITQYIDAPVDAVIAVAGDPRRLPDWAAGLSSGIREESGRWLTDSPMGVVEVRFTGAVALGILDHDVTLPNGDVVSNPLRVLANDHGSEVVFSVFRLDGMTTEVYDEDLRTVAADLARLKAVVEGG